MYDPTSGLDRSSSVSPDKPVPMLLADNESRPSPVEVVSCNLLVVMVRWWIVAFFGTALMCNAKGVP